MARKWTQESIVEAIRAWHRQGRPLSKVCHEDRGLYASAARHFGTWRAALEAAGFAGCRRIWTRQLVIEGIRRRRRQRLPLRGVRRDDPLLLDAAYRHFGGWGKALAAAGLPVRQPRRWTPERVVAAIHAWQGQGKSLSDVWREDEPLCRAGQRFFGTWRHALRAAGIPVDLQRLWTKEKVIAAIRQRQAKGLRMTDPRRDCLSLLQAAQRYCGGWQLALMAAGLPAKPPRKWSRRAVIAAIEAHRLAGVPVSRIWREDRNLLSAARRRFGSWHNALEAAGLPSKPRRRWSRARVIHELRGWASVSNRCLTVLDRPLADAARWYFGSVLSALEAAEVQLGRPRWTRRRICEAIQDGYVQGLSIHRCGFGNEPLAAAAIRHFGGWQNAVAAAGLVSKLAPPAATKPGSNGKGRR